MDFLLFCKINIENILLQSVINKGNFVLCVNDREYTINIRKYNILK